MLSAEVLQEQLELFLAGSAIVIKTFPDWETLPYDAFSPQRIGSINQLFLRSSNHPSVISVTGGRRSAPQHDFRLNPRRTSVSFSDLF